MRILYCGDIVGRSGREVVIANLPELRDKLDLDFVLACGENAAGGFGITVKICNELFAAGIDAITLGNHAWDQREMIGHIDGEKRLIRPHNYPPGTPGRGAEVYPARGGKKVLVIQIMTRLFMDPLDDPFASVEDALASHRLGGTADAVIVDIHGEATSEKMALGHVVDGRASLAAGTHTHAPTADHQILPGGTAYVTDIGMCGDYDSVIGMKKGPPIARFTRKLPTERLSAAEGEGTLCAVYVETDDKTGLASHTAPLRLGGRLAPCWPV
jgi:metallophosphoesterase (TIGR00282 family)